MHPVRGDGSLSAGPAPNPPRLLLGYALLLGSATAFSLQNVASRSAYDFGADAITLTAVRTWVTLAAFALLLRARGEHPRLPRAAWAIFALTLLGYAFHNPATLLAFRYIPVSLAILLLDLFPIIVAVLAAAVARERLRPVTIVAAFVAFGGVALIMDPGGGGVDWRGVALAGAAAFALAINVLGAARLNRHMTPLSIPFALAVVGAPLFSLIMLIDGGPVLLRGFEGWLWFSGAALGNPVALFGFYLALPLIGAARASLTMNSEPVLTLILAFLILGETFGLLQGAGAVLILIALFGSALADFRARRP